MNSRIVFSLAATIMLSSSGWQAAGAQWHGQHPGRGDQSQARDQQDNAWRQREQEIRNQEDAARKQQEQAARQQEETRKEQERAQRQQQEAARRLQDHDMAQRRELQRESDQAQRDQQKAAEALKEHDMRQRAEFQKEWDQQHSAGLTQQKIAADQAQRDQQRAAEALKEHDMRQRAEFQKEWDQQHSAGLAQQTIAADQAQRDQQRAAEALKEHDMRQRAEFQKEWDQQHAAALAQQQHDIRQREEAEKAAIASAGTNLRFPRSSWPGSFMRPLAPKILNFHNVPLEKAVSLPVVDPSWSADDREHAAAVARNLQAHLFAVAGNQMPADFNQLRNNYLGTYLNNYQTYINNQPITINRENCFVTPLPTFEYPYWYQPQSGWVFSNGFTLGNAVRVGLDWLGFGWHPYYGPQPQGFVCANDYVPTPWIYIPAVGLWRIAGEQGYAQAGPPFDYTGPISVEVLEPRHVRIQDPFTGASNVRVVNVMYLYNAFYHPEYERYAYVNRHGYFIWLNF